MASAPKKHRPRHQLTKQQQDQLRPNATARGYGAEYQRLRKRFVKENPLCTMCLDEGKITATEILHHHEPINKRPDLALEWTNFRAICRKHHAQIHANDEYAAVWNKRKK